MHLHHQSVCVVSQLFNKWMFYYEIVPCYYLFFFYSFQAAEWRLLLVECYPSDAVYTNAIDVIMTELTQVPKGVLFL